ncbi:MAG TPA: phospholipase D family protein [Chloroflexota bacterium]|jgi:phosphatidylserine/phosphatidylglycerophosphate/cardiolipin synthase-like enzyme|nr:phospholipase D family protein [Chloroflexota bacterium]
MANTDPAHWFLDAAAVPRTPAFVRGNVVRPLIDGAAYMQDLGDKLARSAMGDYFHFAGWRVSPSQRLSPLVPDSPTFDQLVRSLIAADVQVRVALWYVFGSSLRGSGLLPNVVTGNAALVESVLAAGGQAILDARLARPYHSHHQKTCVLSSGGEDYAYVGGIDICGDRWDTSAHENAPGRSQEGYEGWHDVQSVIHGPAVAQVWLNFAQRWNDSRRPHTVRWMPGGTVPPPITAAPPEPKLVGTHNVQVLRTLACGVYPFARYGEQTVRLGYERAIRRAKHYIYIEDQYLWPCSVANDLRDAAARGVKIILVTSREYSVGGPLRSTHISMRHRLLEHVRGSNPKNVLTFHLQRPDYGGDIYVHSKVIIVDDCYAAIGSANLNFRSQTSDTELQVAVVDDVTLASTMNGEPVQVCRFAAELRQALWTEHLGLMDGGTVADPIVGLGCWPSAERPAQRHHAVWHAVATPGAPVARLLVNLMNPRTDCAAEPAPLG